MSQEPLLLEPPKSRETREVLSLDEKRLRLAEMLASGYKPIEIAEELGVSTGWVRTHKRDGDVVKIVNDLQSEALESAKRYLVSKTVKAAKTIGTLMEFSKDEKVQLAAAKDLLERGGIKINESQQSVGTTINFNFQNMSAEELQIALITRMRALETD